LREACGRFRFADGQSLACCDRTIVMAQPTL
jgi:hypothetical protein